MGPSNLLCSASGREYVIAHALGFATDDLLSFARNVTRMAFISPP